MIKVTRINNSVLYINPDLIEFLEETPDTVISMTTGKKLLVIEPISEIKARIIEYKRQIFSDRFDITTQD
jgi:flagellar protein FlbD